MRDRGVNLTISNAILTWLQTVTKLSFGKVILKSFVRRCQFDCILNILNQKTNDVAFFEPYSY